MSDNLDNIFNELNNESKNRPAIYITRGKIYNKLGNNELMCEDYKKACECAFGSEFSASI